MPAYTLSSGTCHPIQHPIQHPVLRYMPPNTAPKTAPNTSPLIPSPLIPSPTPCRLICARYGRCANAPSASSTLGNHRHPSRCSDRKYDREDKDARAAPWRLLPPLRARDCSADAPASACCWVCGCVVLGVWVCYVGCVGVLCWVCGCRCWVIQSVSVHTDTHAAGYCVCFGIHSCNTHPNTTRYIFLQ